MDYEDSDVTSTGNTTHMNECSICQTELEKNDSLYLPVLASDFCPKCSIKLVELNTLCTSRSAKIHNNNTSLIQADIQNSKRLQELKNKTLGRIKDFKITENINSKILALKRDLHDSVSVIKSNIEQKQRLCDDLNKKQCLLSEKSNRLIDLEKVSKKNEEKINIMDNLLSENQDLLEKIRDFEIDCFLFNRDLVEALKQLKFQSSKERSLKKCSIFHNFTDLQNLQEIQNSLQEEISYTKKRISALSGLLSN